MRPSLRPGEDIVLRTLCKVSESELTGTGGAVLCNGRVQLFCASPLLQETTTLYVVAAPPRLRQTEPATERNGNREFRRNRCAIGDASLQLFLVHVSPFLLPSSTPKSARALGSASCTLYRSRAPTYSVSRSYRLYIHSVYSHFRTDLTGAWHARSAARLPLLSCQ